MKVVVEYDGFTVKQAEKFQKIMEEFFKTSLIPHIKGNKVIYEEN
jgi:hypothetical protein